MALTKAKLIADGVIVAANLHSSHGITSANIGENTNLYFTDARARSAISVSGNALSYNSSTGVITSNFEESPTFTGAVVGSSFSAAGGFLNGSNGGIRVHVSGTKFFNITAANAARDNIMDIGASDARFKDLYLGGNIQAAGNVGIGTTSPEEKLDVSGSVIINNNEFYKVESTSGTNYKIAGLTSGNMIQIGAIDYTSAGTIFAGGDNVSITTGGAAGTTRIKIDSSGLVGIGTATPSSYNSNANKLVIAGSGNTGLTIAAGTSDDNNIFFSDGTSGDAAYRGIFRYSHSADAFKFYTAGANERMIINSSGNVGIGLTSPAVKLEIQDSTHTTMKIRSGNNDNILFAQALQSDEARIGTDTNSAISFFTNTGRRMTITTSGLVGIGTNLPQSSLHISTSATNAPIRLQNDNGSGSTANYVLQTDSQGLGNNGFGIYDVAQSAYRFVIDGSGEIGIGVTSPSAKLDVDGTIRLSTSGRVEGRSYPYTTNIGSTANATTTNITAGSTDKSEISLLGGDVGDRIEFKTNSTERMRIDSSGRVGINETAPAAKLQVSGARNGTSEYVAILGEDGGATGAANSASTSPVHKTLITGYSIPYSGQTNARLTSVGFLEFDSTPGWTGNQRNWALTSGYDMGGTGGPKFAIILGNAQNVEPQLGTNGAVGTGDGSNTLVATHWNNARKMTHTGALHVDSVITANDSISIQNNDSGFVCKNSAGTVIGTIGAASSSLPNIGQFTVRDNGNNRIVLHANGSSYFNGGSVGIGVTSPAAKLHVSGDTGGADSIVRFQNTNSTAKSTRIQLLDSAGNVGDALIAYDHSNANSALHYLGMGVNNSTSLVIDNNDNVGIGTTSPGAKFEVNTGGGSTAFMVKNSSGLATYNEIDGGYSNLYLYQTGGGAKIVLNSNGNTYFNGGNVGINTTTPYGKLYVNGSLTVGPANQDSAVTLTETGDDVSLNNGGGSIEINMPIQGTTTNGCTLTFTYAAASWKSWVLDYEFASTDGMVKGVVGGYNNGSTGHSKTKMVEGFPTSVAVAATGSGNQHVQVTFTFSSSMGIHPLARFIYSQGGGDGTPRPDRVTVAYVEGS